MPPNQHDERVNADGVTVDGFGREWATFDHQDDRTEMRKAFAEYFAIFPWDRVSKDAVGVDLGCGSGRWARYVAPRVGKLYCLDASGEALDVARRNLIDRDNVEFLHSTIEDSPIPDGSLDFAYSLGVLHHVPDTAGAMSACVRRLRAGAPMLVYLYYALDNRSTLFRTIWRASDVIRRGVCRLPFGPRLAFSEVLARTVYWPLARGAALGELLGANVSQIPLAYYRDKSLYVMRNDALDRFGTKLEKRYTRADVIRLMEGAGLRDVIVGEGAPYWCAVGYKP